VAQLGDEAAVAVKLRFVSPLASGGQLTHRHYLHRLNEAKANPFQGNLPIWDNSIRINFTGAKPFRKRARMRGLCLETDGSVARSPDLKVSISLRAGFAAIDAGSSAAGIFQSMTPIGWRTWKNTALAQIN
jgi:hypothetical protein